MNIIIVGLIALGLFFLFISAVGALRLPDFSTRAHALAVTDTLGSFLLLLGLIFHYGVSITSAKILLLIIFIQIANPTITHVLFRAAWRSGLKPWEKKDV